MTRTVHGWIGCLLLSVACLAADSQTSRFSQFTTANGLPSDEVFNLHSSNDGYIWIFTNYGTVKYNSVSFSPVLTNLSFSESFIYSCFEDKHGNMWVANSRCNIYRVRNDSAFQVKGTEKVSAMLRKEINEIMQLYVDDSLNIYACTKHLSFKFVHDSIYTPVNLSAAIHDPDLSMRVLNVDNVCLPVYNFNGNDSSFCAGHTSTIIEFQNGPRLVLPCRPSILRHVRRMHNDVYYSHHGVFGKVTGSTSREVALGYVQNFIMDRRHHIWAGVLNNGLYELDTSLRIVNHYFDNATINDVCEDFQGGLWVSTRGSGLYHCASLDNVYFTGGVAGKQISVMQRIGDRVYAFTSSGDIVVAGASGLVQQQPNSDPDDPFAAFAEKDRLVVRFRYGEREYAIEPAGLREIYRSTGVPGDVLRLSYGDTTWLMLQREIRCKVKDREICRIPLLWRPYGMVRYNGITLLGSENGVWRVRPDGVDRPSWLAATADNRIATMTEGPLGNLWIASVGGGLFTTDGSKMREFTREELPSLVIRNISFADSTALLCTNVGLFSSSFGQSRSFHWRRVLVGNCTAAFQLGSTVYVATVNGLVMLKSVPGAGGSARLNIAHVLVNGKYATVPSLAELSYDQNDVQVHADLISYSGARPMLHYQLKGPTQDSGYIDGLELIFNTLAPGKYRLRLDAAGAQPAYRELSIVINPAFWQTWWFSLLCVLISLIGMTAVFTTVLKFLRRREARKQEARRMLAEYKLIAIKAQINPHFMSNCLSAIQLLIANNQLQEATTYVARFGLFVRQILNFSGKSFISLKEELSLMELYVQLEQLRFEQKFEYRVRIDAQIDPGRALLPSLLLNPIIENAIWHGLLPLKDRQQGLLKVDVTRHGDRMTISIRDNGAGRSASARKSGERASKGMDMLMQRLVHLNEHMPQAEASFRVVDHMENGAAAGTEVIISLSYALNATAE